MKGPEITKVEQPHIDQPDRRGMRGRRNLSGIVAPRVAARAPLPRPAGDAAEV